MSVIFNGMKGEAGDGFNGIVIDIENPIDSRTGQPCGAGYFTVLPVSPWSYRKTSNTGAKYQNFKRGTLTDFIVSDDYGTKHMFSIDNDDPVIKTVFEYFKQENIPNK